MFATSLPVLSPVLILECRSNDAKCPMPAVKELGRGFEMDPSLHPLHSRNQLHDQAISPQKYLNAYTYIEA